MMAAARTSLTMASGQLVNLLDPRPEDIDFHVMAEHLSKVIRYNGATPGQAYSVAEHVCRGADELLNRGAGVAAAYFLLHDGHEAFLGDDTTPKKRALDAIAESFGTLAGAVSDAFAGLTAQIDAAIHAAAGLDWPPPQEIAAAVKHMDAIMLATEWRDLMRCEPPYELELPLAEPIQPWDWWLARDELRRQFRRLLPRYGGRP